MTLLHEAIASLVSRSLRQATQHSCALGRAAVQYVCYVIHVRDQARLRAMNRRQSQTCFKRGDLRIADAAGSDDPAQSVFAPP